MHLFEDYDMTSREGLDHILNNIIEYGHTYNRKFMYGIARSLHSVLTMDDDYKKRATEHMLQRMREKSNVLEKRREALKNEMSNKIPQYFHYDLLTNVTDVIHSRPIERHVRGLDYRPEDNHQNVLNIVNNLTMQREYVRKIYYYLYLYVYELTIKMQYVKSQIFKLEFANQFEFEKTNGNSETTSEYVRKGMQTGTVLDSIIYYYMDMYMEMDKEFRRYGKEMYLCNVDSDVEDSHGRFINGNTILQNYHGVQFNFCTRLPVSVHIERKKKYNEIMRMNKHDKVKNRSPF